MNADVAREPRIGSSRDAERLIHDEVGVRRCVAARPDAERSSPVRNAAIAHVVALDTAPLGPRFGDRDADALTGIARIDLAQHVATDQTVVPADLDANRIRVVEDVRAADVCDA